MEWMVPSVTSLAKKLLPQRLAAYAREYREVPALARSEYLRFCFSKALKAGPWRQHLPEGACSFLFICHGNIMRSPFCETLLKGYLSHLNDNAVSIASAGLHAQPGSHADPLAIGMARELGVSLDPHRSRLITPEIVAQADVIFAMDFRNYVELLSYFPTASNKILMLGIYASPSARTQIPDPYKRSEDELRRCYALIDICVRNLAKEIRCSEENAAKSMQRMKLKER